MGSARQQILAKEKALTSGRDALTAERRRMPWVAVEKKYEFDGLSLKVHVWKAQVVSVKFCKSRVT